MSPPCASGSPASAISLRRSETATATVICWPVMAQVVAEDSLPLDDWAARSAAGQWQEQDVAAASAHLLAVKGSGPWTVNYTLLRGYGWPDGSLHGDVAVRRAIGLLTGSDKPDARAASDWLEQFRPWRALVAAHLWASLADSAY